MTAPRMPANPTVAQLIEALRAMPQGKIVEVCMPADEAHDPDQEPTNRDDLYATLDRVDCKGDVVILYAAKG